MVIVVGRDGVVEVDRVVEVDDTPREVLVERTDEEEVG